MTTNAKWIALAAMLSLFALTMVSIAGCGQTQNDASSARESEDQATPVAESDHHEDHHEDHHASHNLHGWWCAEHGVPESECARCQPALVAEFKQKGDWCEEHNRPDSQCFICHPELQEQFAARFEAKFGEKPPEPTE